MKTLALALLLCFTLTAANRPNYRAPIYYRPRPVVVVRPYYFPQPYYGAYYNPWIYYGTVYPVAPAQPNPCHKEKLKDSNGIKHEILVCKNTDGSFTIVDPDNK